jgi:hypothetical protein
MSISSAQQGRQAMSTRIVDWNCLSIHYSGWQPHKVECEARQTESKDKALPHNDNRLDQQIHVGEVLSFAKTVM